MKKRAEWDDNALRHRTLGRVRRLRWWSGLSAAAKLTMLHRYGMGWLL